MRAVQACTSAAHRPAQGTATRPLHHPRCRHHLTRWHQVQPYLPFVNWTWSVVLLHKGLQTGTNSAMEGLESASLTAGTVDPTIQDGWPSPQKDPSLSNEPMYHAPGEQIGGIEAPSHIRLGA